MLFNNLPRKKFLLVVTIIMSLFLLVGCSDDNDDDNLSTNDKGILQVQVSIPNEAEDIARVEVDVKDGTKLISANDTEVIEDNKAIVALDDMTINTDYTVEVRAINNDEYVIFHGEQDNVKLLTKDEINDFNINLKKAEAKYVFYMIGDGMGEAHRKLGESLLQVIEGDSSAKLTMNTFPVTGKFTTRSANEPITDSAAAGTALATGSKTNNGMIAELPNGTELKTLVEAAKEKGMATGIMTTTRINHATPAVFAAHNDSRHNYNDIAVDYLDSGVDFFAGGGYRYFIPQGTTYLGRNLDSEREDGWNLIDSFEDEGYITFLSEEESEDFIDYLPAAGDKVFATFTNYGLPYDINRQNLSLASEYREELLNIQTPSIAEVTQKAIELLSQDEDGFFMMVEGGRIDHAAHGNDIAGTAYDTIAFDKAVEKAYEFYQEHPYETLIVVLADHETGGLELTGDFDAEILKDVKLSKWESSLQYFYDGDREAFYEYIAENYGLSNLTADEKERLEEAMNEAEANDINNPYQTAEVASQILSERVGVTWSTDYHTDADVPLSAIGLTANPFSQVEDNTDVAKTMAKILDLKIGVEE
ncbi:alkaline phosphatase [Orenia metallireducens]|uniref:alkaline phosphatase n=1 Tax=Orenia metallireducens TaxID=1413210 RepID=UPI000D41A6AF|nr:alkaline phosphatase [Orenia metallireducens]PRX31062.1 alkaline phosphatase [Orenia metallireducens]